METTAVHSTELRELTAVILAAGQGTRMGVYTAERPKCLLEVEPGVTLLGLQLDRLFESGVRRVVVVAGWQVDKVEAFLRRRGHDWHAHVEFNPFFDVSNNLHSLWLARDHLVGGGLIVNGDDLFHPLLVPRMLAVPGDVVVTTNRKSSYDADDMKVQARDGRLLRIGKDIALDAADGEAIGLIRVSARGAWWLRQELEAAVRAGDRNQFYLKAFRRLMEEERPVVAADITGLPWAEVDEPRDLQAARARSAEFVPLVRRAERAQRAA